MQFRCRQDSVKTDQSHIYYFCGRVGGGGVEKLRLRLSQLPNKVEVEVEANLGNIV